MLCISFETERATDFYRFKVRMNEDMRICTLIFLRALYCKVKSKRTKNEKKIWQNEIELIAYVRWQKELIKVSSVCVNLCSSNNNTNINITTHRLFGCWFICALFPSYSHFHCLRLWIRIWVFITFVSLQTKSSQMYLENERRKKTIYMLCKNVKYASIKHVKREGKIKHTKCKEYKIQGKK